MTQDSLGIAVIGVAMVGRAHAAGYRTAGSRFDITGRPDTRLVAIADADEPARGGRPGWARVRAS
ncbi:MAG: hypothetical protein ABIR34_00235 [Marmoricola sp.]